MEYIDTHRFLVDVLPMNFLQKNVLDNKDILNPHGVVVSGPKN
jgi:hypothetical protein